VITYSHVALSSKDQRALKDLKKIRKAAGNVRDFDIQIALLQSEQFKTGSINGSAGELAGVLTAKRQKACKKLRNGLASVTKNKDLQRLDKVCRAARKSASETDLQTILVAIQDVATSADLNDAEGLHNVRIKLKKIRYALEANETESAKPLIDGLKSVHDAIGEWHDWVMLGDAARDHFPARSAIVVEIKRTAASLFVRALEMTSSFLAAFVLKKKPKAATAVANVVQIRA
jgi:CHAD domain-containing protein